MSGPALDKRAEGLLRCAPPPEDDMASTRRTLLKSAGMAAVAGTLLKPDAAQAQQPSQTSQGGASPRNLAYCNLRTGLGVKQGDRILDVARAGKQLKVAVPATTDEVMAGKNLEGLRKVVQAAPKNATLGMNEAQFGPC